MSKQKLLWNEYTVLLELKNFSNGETISKVENRPMWNQGKVWKILFTFYEKMSSYDTKVTKKLCNVVDG